MKITPDKWVWMPHAGHFILGNQCRFVMNTRVGKYIVSTVGEYWPDYRVRKIHAEVHDVKWLAANSHLMGDAWDAAYFKRFGFEELGYGRTYETMVFRAAKSKDKCCPWRMTGPSDLDFRGYKNADDAYKGHMAMCRKYANK